MRSLSQAGDTIVEVIIAIAIISLVLVGAYVSVNKNTQTLQNTQERAMAQKIVASQIDELHALNGLPAGKTCFDPHTNNATPTSGTNCVLSSPTGSGADYNISVTPPSTRPPSACNQNATPTKTYTICASWTSLGSTNTTGDDSNVTVYYSL